jgi:Tol biopolymer transport system component
MFTRIHHRLLPFALFLALLWGSTLAAPLLNVSQSSGFQTFMPYVRSDDMSPLIAFVSRHHGNPEIYTMNADGSNVRRLTFTPAAEWGPAWSPDGRQIAFVSERDGNQEIYVMNADGSQQTRLTNHPAPDGGPAWSPDGRLIAFSTTRESYSPYSLGVWLIYVMNADGTNPRRISPPDAYHDGEPAWSPDGQRLAFSSQRDSRWSKEIYVMDADGSNLTRLTENTIEDISPAWSPDGQTLVYSSSMNFFDMDLYLMRRDGTNKRRVNMNFPTGVNASWSPDGRRIVYNSGYPLDGDYLFITTLDGKEPINLTTLNGHIKSYDPAWAPK